MRVRTLGAAIGASLIAAGCGSAAGRTATAIHAGGQSGEQVSCSFAVDYRSLAQLRRDATSVAVVAATGAARTRREAGLPMRDATVVVVRHVAGKRLPSRITKLDGADPSVDGSNTCFPMIVKGNAYLLYLMATTSRRYWVVGGPQGAYVHHGTLLPHDSERSFVHQESDVGRSLPRRISIAEARES